MASEAEHQTVISMGKVFRIFEAGVPFAECFDSQTNT